MTDALDLDSIPRTRFSGTYDPARRRFLPADPAHSITRRPIVTDKATDALDLDAIRVVLDEANQDGNITYDLYSRLHDMAGELIAEVKRLRAATVKPDMEAIVALIDFLADARDEYATGTAQDAIRAEAAPVRLIARALRDPEESQGWLPSWRWDEYAERHAAVLALFPGRTEAEVKEEALWEAVTDFESDVHVEAFREQTIRDGRGWVAADEAWEHQGPFMDWLRNRADRIAAEGDGA